METHKSDVPEPEYFHRCREGLSTMTIAIRSRWQISLPCWTAATSRS